MTTDSERRDEILDAAARVFIRFGFRKTTMDEVAHAAGLSRQGLYLHFAKKTDLFRAAVAHIMARGDAAAAAALSSGQPIEDRLVAAYDAVHGHLVEDLGQASNLDELYQASQRLVGDLVERHTAAFVQRVADALEDAGVAAQWAQSGLSSLDLADSLDATASGLKHRGGTRADYLDGMRTAARILCRSRP